MSSKAITGPVFADLDEIGDGNLTLATAFYSAGALNSLNFEADSLRLLVRLNTSSVLEWATRAIDPLALLKFMERHIKTCGSVSLFVSPTAHAKVYKGRKGFFVGSANLSWRAFSGHGQEILWFENDRKKNKLMDVALKEYEACFQIMDFDELGKYVKANLGPARTLSKKLPRELNLNEDRMPATVIRPIRLGDYSDFLNWLGRQRGDAVATIADRANGAGNLSGHIRQNFYGLRQFFLGYPTAATRLAKASPDTYSLTKDLLTAPVLSSFVRNQACDEGPFSVSTWRTYLPENAGGKPKSGGGTSGNLKRMLPIVARYVQSRVKAENN